MHGVGRATLAAVASGLERLPADWEAPVTSASAPADVLGFDVLTGRVPWGSAAVRVDLYEAWTAAIRAQGQRGPIVVPLEMLELLGDPAPYLRAMRR